MSEHEQIMQELKALHENIHVILKRLDGLKIEGNMTRKQVSEEFNISLPTIHQHMKTAKLPFFKIGRKTLFKREDVEAWAQSWK